MEQLYKSHKVNKIVRHAYCKPLPSSLSTTAHLWGRAVNLEGILWLSVLGLLGVMLWGLGITA